MPNWCANTADIFGPANVIRKLETAAREGNLFTSLRPMPKELENTISPSEGPNWYDWSVSNWGTKWDTGADVTVIEPNDSYGTAGISLSFDTAWAPPIEWYSYISEEYALIINASYYEPGMGYVGTWSEGECHQYDLSGHDSTTVREHIGADLDDQWNISENMAEWESDLDV
jgi:hypothetical protein